MKFNVQINIEDATEDEIRAYFNRGTSAAALSATVHATSTLTPTNGAASADEDGDGSINNHAPAADTAGIPWDERIHSRNKGLNADGTWRKKRNIDGALYAAVEAELKLRTAQFQPPGMPNGQTPHFTPPSSQVPMPQQPQYQPQPYQPQPQFQPPGMPAPNGQTMPQAPGPIDFNGFMTHLAGQMQKRDQTGQPLITVDYLTNVCQRLSAQFQRQFNSITDISTDPNWINAAVAFITADGRWN